MAPTATFQSNGRSASRLPRPMLLLVILVLAWGTFLRGWRLADRPFWRDEAWIAQAVTDNDYLGLVRTPDVPLPPLFSMALKLTHRHVTSAELAFRLLPMLCGAAVPLVMYVAARALYAPRSLALAGMVLGSCGYTLINWSREAKQYSVEAFLATCLAALVFHIHRDAGRRRRAWSVVGIVLICLWGPALGYGVVFPAAAVLMVLIVVRRPRRAGGTQLSNPRRWVANGRVPNRLIGLVALAGLAASSLLLSRVLVVGQARNAALREYWRPFFVHADEFRSWLHAGAQGASAVSMMLTPLAEEPQSLVPILACAIPTVLLALVGIVTWPRRGRLSLVVWVVGPWFLVLTAAVAHQYPFGPMRLLLFTVPSMLIAVAAGIVSVCRTCALVLAGRGGPGLIVGILATALPSIWASEVPLQHRHCIWHDFPTLLRVLREQRQSGERVLLTRDSATCVRYYAGAADSDFTDIPLVAGTIEMRDYDYDALAREAVGHAGARCWMLTTSTDSSRVRTVMRSELRRLHYGERLVAEARLHPVQPVGVAQLFVYEARSRF